MSKKYCRRYMCWIVLTLSCFAVIGATYCFYLCYSTSWRMNIPVLEFQRKNYPDNPANLSQNEGKYSHKKLILIKKDTAHFDFVFLPANRQSATIIFRNVDVALMTPNVPEWVKNSSELIRVALVDRQWNRQQVAFNPHSPSIEVFGGDGFEKKYLYSAELAKNCLNAGLWEVLLFTKEHGEQHRKHINMVAPDIRIWGDFLFGRPIYFASFVPPGVYQLNNPWGNEYWRLAHFNGVVLRNIKSLAEPNKTLQELELQFSDDKGNKSFFIISGFSFNQLPRLNMENYDKGFFMPMGIGVPPVYQSYAELLQSPPNKNPFFSVYIDEHKTWINHHQVAIDGPLIFRDKDNEKLLHVYFISYERIATIAHYTVTIN